MIKNTIKIKLFLAVLSAAVAALTVSCASSRVDYKEMIKPENNRRAYERLISDHELKERSLLNSPGLHYYGKAFFVVISLTDSGMDSYSEWAARKLLEKLYAYKIISKNNVSEEDFYLFSGKFKIDTVTQKNYENIAIIKIKENDVIKFIISILEK